MEPVTTVATVSTWAAIKAAIVAVPKLIDGIRDIVKAIERAGEMARDAKIQEIRTEQAAIRRAIEGVKSDADRAAIVERISRLERGITGK